MKKFLSFILVSTIIFSPFLVEAKNTYQPKTSHSYITGQKGGCYYINKNSNKTYVDRSLCK